MKTVIILGKRRSAKKMFFLLIPMILFLFGIFVGIFYQPKAKDVHLPFALIMESQWFYCGDISDLKGISKYLPPLEERDQQEASFAWDISSYKDDVSGKDIPVFVSAIQEKSADLVRVPQTPLELTSLLSDTPQVLIYSTHTSEDYADGGTVVDVANSLKDSLATNYGIQAVVSDKVHDSPEWYKSYANSRETASSMLSEYPDAKLIIDLHRDGGTKKGTTTMLLNGTPSAKILFVVGSNLTMKHPNWEENLITANAVAASIQNVNKDIVRGVRVQKGRYNQHLTKNAILLEFGSDLNTIEEAKTAAAVVAEGISQYLQGITAQ